VHLGNTTTTTTTTTTTNNNNNNNNNNNSVCNKLGIETTENWYSHIPKSVSEHVDMSVMESRGTVQTDREVLADRPDITVENKGRI
jgi:hypothetical protein